MIMRIKYKTEPGQQFIIRKEVYRLMQEAFREAGIEFAHRNVTVYMPPEDAEAENDDTSDQKMTDKAAAAAAIAVAQAEADELAKTDEQKPK
jgi:small-conductance mechanosensitive channel